MSSGTLKPAHVAFGSLAPAGRGRLEGKVAVISGASRGFGQAIAVRFVEEGAFVVMLSRSPCTETEGLVHQIAGVTREYADAHLLWVSADIESEADCGKAVAAATAKFGPAIHVLVNNAALFVFHSVETATAEDWDRSAAVNIKGHALLTKACLPAMKAAGNASIVWQGSISSFLAQVRVGVGALDTDSTHARTGREGFSQIHPAHYTTLNITLPPSILTHTLFSPTVRRTRQ